VESLTWRVGSEALSIYGKHRLYGKKNAKGLFNEKNKKRKERERKEKKILKQINPVVD